MLDDSATRYGAVETPQEGEIYANFLRETRQVWRRDRVPAQLRRRDRRGGRAARSRRADLDPGLPGRI